jgi:glycosyltransferase involved in cell wall biosynthesis
MQKRVLIITEAGKAWPSGWVRALIYQDLFRTRNIRVDYMTRQAPWLANLQGTAGPIFSRLLNAGLAGILSRLSVQIARAREQVITRWARKHYDAIYLQKTGSFELVCALRQVCDARLVFDLNDAVWLPANAAYAKGKVREILGAVDAVTCDNPHGLAFARSYNQNVFLVPDPAQFELFNQHRNCVPKSDTLLILGWIGGPFTLFNLFSIWEALEALFSRHEGITLRLVGTGYNRFLLPRFEKVRFSTVPYYSQSDMVREVLGMDIGLFPLFDVEDSLARGILKATIYMSGETAVIASPRGQLVELIQDGVNGMLANSTAEWIEKLELLITDHALRKRIAAAGLETVRRDYSLERSFECLLHALGLENSVLN